ncbi:single-stranded DNA-binding protein [Pseudonocardia sp. KRD-182]|uniref:single-stranded DNA-binding protein n=1 Tax=Pseudonocardia oceani TaxID=2792013 RepID=UPI001C4A33B7|nr:single-stranded DNA-binding protein [Pseudonocardia oceani]MBW0109975.1 single-stranded DNA-binding protein [Pseudonocardia oceani]
MNKITVHGNVTGKPELRFSRSGVPVATFTVAANRRRLNRGTGRWVDLPPVFHRVVCFNALAENIAASLDKGATVAVTGEFADDSYKREDGTVVRRIQIEAADVAASLRYATATLVKNPRTTHDADRADRTEPDATQPDSDAPADEAAPETGTRPELAIVGSD